MILKNLTFEKCCDVGELHKELKDSGVTFSGVSCSSNIIIVYDVEDSQVGMVQSIVGRHNSIPKTDEEIIAKVKSDFSKLSTEEKLQEVFERLGLQ